MENDIDKVLSMIKGIEKKNMELERFLSSIKIISRRNLLKQINFDIIRNIDLFQELHVGNTGLYLPKEDMENILINKFIEEILLNIQDNPSKKVIYLRKFLDQFEEISQNDKDVILQSLKNKDNMIELNQEMFSLVKIFKIKDLE